MATECPECGSMFKGYKCSCGYKVPFSKPKPTSSLCAAHGCPMAGTISHSLSPDKDGHREWLCSFHFGREAKEWPGITEKIATGNLSHPRKGEPSVKLGVLATVKEKSTRRWAHQVMALNDSGLYDCYHGLKMAKDVLGIAQQEAA